jgi:universal stress protein E
MATPIRTIVAGLGTLSADDPVLASALKLASSLGATLHLVHAYHLPEPIGAAYAREIFLDRRLLDRYGDQLQVELESVVRQLEPGEDVHCHAIEGPASECLAEFGAEVGADLLLVGATRRSRLWRQFLGTTAEGVIRSATVPVLVLRQPINAARARVLLTTDLTAASALTHRQGVKLARSLFAGGTPALRTLLVVQHDGPLSLHLRADLLQQVGQNELGRFLAANGESAGAGRIRVGEPDEEILSEAAEWQADLVVVGMHSRTAVYRFLLGSVASAVLRGTSCNVLVAPSEQGEPRPVSHRTRSAEPVGVGV